MNPVRLARLGMVWIGLWLTALLPLLSAQTHAEHCLKQATPQAYLYTGEQIDPELGMYYLRARYYQPSLGRFWNMDSYEGETEDPISLHKYLYCNGNPVNGIDPSGHFFDGGSFMASGTMQNLMSSSRITVTQGAVQVAKKSIASSISRQTLAALGVAVYFGTTTTIGDEDDLRVLIYRGIPRSRTRDYDLALVGIAMPRGTRLDYAALEMHVRNEDVASGVTSWTTLRDKARAFSGSDGIILETELIEHVHRIVPRPLIGRYDSEHEILLRGTIRARPTQP